MKSRDRLTLAIVGIAALAGAFWFLSLAPKREEAGSLKDQVAQAEARRDQALAHVANAERARASYTRDYATLARLGKAVPAKTDVPSLVYQLATAARAAKVDFRKVMVTDTETAAPPSIAADGTPEPATTSQISPTPFTFTFEGDFFALNRMLREISRFSTVKGDKVSVRGRLLTIDRVDLSAGASGLPSLKAEVTANAYVAPVATVVAGAPAAQTTATTTPTSAPRPR